MSWSVSSLAPPWAPPWAPWAPQRGWNHKLLITHGASCGIDHQSGSAPGVVNDPALSRGFAVMSTALDNAGHNCSLATEAESLVMAKEHLVEAYGTIRYTIGTGCSGGSLVQQQVANAYPGVYQGILPQCSFPDAWSTGQQLAGYHLTRRYFEAWLAQLANYALITILTVLVAALLLQIVESYADQTAARGTAIVTVDALNMVLIAVLVFLLMRQVMPIAAALAGGIALNSFGTVSRLIGWGMRTGMGATRTAGRLAVAKVANRAQAPDPRITTQLTAGRMF